MSRTNPICHKLSALSQRSPPPTTPGYKVGKGIKTVTTLPSGLTGDLNYIITTQQQQPTCGQRALAILLLQLLLPIKFQLKTFQPHLSRSLFFGPWASPVAGTESKSPRWNCGRVEAVWVYGCPKP